MNRTLLVLSVVIVWSCQVLGDNPFKPVAAPQISNEYELWRSVDGQYEILAKFVSGNRNVITLEQRGGGLVQIDVADLDAASQREAVTQTLDRRARPSSAAFNEYQSRLAERRSYALNERRSQAANCPPHHYFTSVALPYSAPGDGRYAMDATVAASRRPIYSLPVPYFTTRRPVYAEGSSCVRRRATTFARTR